MKLARTFPKFLAKSYQEEDLRRVEIQLQYHKGMARVFQQRVAKGREELERLSDQLAFSLADVCSVAKGREELERLRGKN